MKHKLHIETDYYKARKYAEKQFLKMRIKRCGIRWFIKQFFIWLYLFFTPTYISYDEEKVGDVSYLSVVQAKKAFGKLYIMQNDEYINSRLQRTGRMTFKDFFIPYTGIRL